MTMHSNALHENEKSSQLRVNRERIEALVIV
jgi:hypothetical protein